jgi:heme a synthase
MAATLASSVTNQHDQTSASNWDGAVRTWLWLVAALVLTMIGVGGATRLTDSGLSITEWQPILGAIPPLSDADWQIAFAKYQQSSEYHLVNKGMTLDGFKPIFWWEWSHRFLGRFIGLAFAVPLAFFWAKGALRPGMGRKMLVVLALGGLQGVIGWFMVKSGLVDRVDVSHYRLALHLSVAFLLLSALVWLALEHGKQTVSAVSSTTSQGQLRLAALIVGLVFLQVAMGAFVAGLKAGLHYNTWPLMNGALIPDDILSMSPAIMNVFENPTTVQFNHRLVAYIVLAVAVWNAFRLRKAGADVRIQRSANLLTGAVLAQASLGILTLLWAVPIGLGVAHQVGGALVLAVAVWHFYLVSRARIGRLGPIALV